jgi:hypothetical protein
MAGSFLKLIVTAAMALALTSLAIQPLFADDIDWNRAKELYQKEQSGQPLTPEEQAYLARAKQEHAAMAAKAGQPSGSAIPVPPARSETGLVPLTNLTVPYQGEDGGLYGKGQNEPPAALAAAAKTQTAKIVPLNAQGSPSPEGKIVLLSIGMSNTTMEFSSFLQAAHADPSKSQKLVIVDGAQGGQTAERIANPDNPFWGVIGQRLAMAGVTPQQVQVIWFKEANAGPRAGFPAEATKLKDDIIDDLNIAKKDYPNLRVAYLSSRIYAGYAVTPLNPEPYAYESAFAVRWVIEGQMQGDPKLNYDPAKGEVKSPLVLWGPYWWADGVKGRKEDNLIWNREDFGRDGTHPSASGRQKAAGLLLNFFKTDPFAKTWFIGG